MRADRIEIPASITAVGFYKKQEYDYKNGINELDEEDHSRLEKINVKKGVDYYGTFCRRKRFGSS